MLERALYDEMRIGFGLNLLMVRPTLISMYDAMEVAMSDVLLMIYNSTSSLEGSHAQ